MWSRRLSALAISSTFRSPDIIPDIPYVRATMTLWFACFLVRSTPRCRSRNVASLAFLTLELELNPACSISVVVVYKMLKWRATYYYHRILSRLPVPWFRSDSYGCWRDRLRHRKTSIFFGTQGWVGRILLCCLHESQPVSEMLVTSFYVLFSTLSVKATWLIRCT